MTLAPHPYADAWPMLGADDLAELAEDIALNGLRDAIVVYDGKILDGRNRHAACQQLGIEAERVEFEGDDDDALAFVQSVNNARRHQSKGSLAASWALSMLAAGKRAEGRWAYGASKSSDLKILDSHRSYLGVIADHAPDLLIKVRDDEMSLNAAHGQAEKARDAERDRLEREERAAAEESEAEAFVKENAPDLVSVVRDAGWSWVAARTEWERRNREAAEELRRAKEAEAKAAREHKAAMTDHFSHQMGRALSTLGGYGARENPLDVMAEFSPTYLDPPQMERFFTLDNIQAVRRFVDALIEWKAAR